MIEELETEAHDITVATGFLACCDKRRYGKVLDDLENDCIKGDFNYPRDMPAAYKMLSEYNTGVRSNSNASQTTGLAFAQRVMKCYGCGKLNYTKRTCPECSKTYKPRAFDKGKGGQNNYSKQDKGDKKVSFAQVKSNKKSKKKQWSSDQSTELAFTQIATLNKSDRSVQYLSLIHI